MQMKCCHSAHSAMQMLRVPSVPAASQIEGVENKEGGGLAELHLNQAPPQTTCTVNFSKFYKSCNINYSIILLI